MSSRERALSIQLDGAGYDIIGSTSTTVRMVEQTTGEEKSVSTAALADALAVPAGTSPRVFDHLDERVVSEVVTLADDLDEVLTGVGRNNTARPEYDTATTTQETRVTRKLRELTATGRGMSRATFFRKLTAYRSEGIVGLIDGRALRQQGPLDRVDDRILTELLSEMAAQSHISTGTKARITLRTRAQVRKLYGDIPTPSNATFYRLIDCLDAGRHTTGSARTRRSLAERPDRTFAKNVPLFPGSEVQIDSTPLDVFVRTPDGKTVRPVLTIMVDVCSRSILASTLRLKATKAVDHVLLLAQSLVPRTSRPSRAPFRELVQRAHPGISLIPAEEYEVLAQAHPYIYPRRVMQDNGRDYLSTTFRAACEKFGLDVTLSPPHTPTSKPHVERMFGSINHLFVQHLPGYTGRGVEFRGAAPEKEELLTVEALRELFEDWVLRDWQNRPHSELRDRLHPTRLRTPNQVASEAAYTAAQLRLPLSRNDYISLLDTRWRVITSTGIQIDNRRYDSELLHPLRNSRSAHKRHGGKWEVKVDPYAPGCVWVVTREGEFIECRERGADVYEYEPQFDDAPPAAAEYRELNARADAELTGTALPAPVVVPQVVPDDPEDDDDEYELPDF